MLSSDGTCTAEQHTLGKWEFVQFIPCCSHSYDKREKKKEKDETIFLEKVMTHSVFGRLNSERLSVCVPYPGSDTPAGHQVLHSALIVSLQRALKLIYFLLVTVTTYLPNLSPFA